MSPGGDSTSRDLLANERTLLAWVRTALTLLAAGVAAPTLLRGRAGPLGTVVGVGLMALAAAAALGGYRRWRSYEEALREGRPLPSHARGVQALVAAVVAVAAVAAVVIVVTS